MYWIILSTFIWILFVMFIFHENNQEYKTLGLFIIIVIILRDILATIAYFTM